MGPAGPQGEQGVQGERGERGPQGISGITTFTLIEERLDDGEWEEDLNSYYLRDSRIQPETVAGVYVKRFYTNTGQAYYMSILDWLLAEDLENYRVDGDPVIVQVSSGLVRFYDQDQLLRNETVAVAITLP